MLFKLKSINRILRWTGFRIEIEVDDDIKRKLSNNLSIDPTKIGFTWYGWSFIRELDKDLK